MTTSRSSFNIVVCAALALCLAGCVMAAEKLYLQKKPLDNLLNQSYAAADHLTIDAQSRLSERTVIAIKPFYNTADTTDRSEFGPYVAGEMGKRLRDLGYTVRDDRAIFTPPGSVVRPEALPAVSPRATGIALSAHLTGGYEIRDRKVVFATCLVDDRAGTVLATADFAANVTDDIRQRLGRDWLTIIKNSFNLGDTAQPARPAGAAGGKTPEFEEFELNGPVPTGGHPPSNVESYPLQP